LIARQLFGEGVARRIANLEAESKKRCHDDGRRDHGAEGGELDAQRAPSER